MTLSQVEMKLASLERDVEELKRKQNDTPPRSGKWWIEHSGTFVNDPVYAEIVRLGRKYRESLRPKPRKRKR